MVQVKQSRAEIDHSRQAVLWCILVTNNVQMIPNVLVPRPSLGNSRLKSAPFFQLTEMNMGPKPHRIQSKRYPGTLSTLPLQCTRLLYDPLVDQHEDGNLPLSTGNLVHLPMLALPRYFYPVAANMHSI